MKILISAQMTSHFTGSTVNERPLGGSESALFYLTREMAARGHQIYLFNNCFTPNEGNYDGVEYRQFTNSPDLVKFSKEQDLDIFVSFRDLRELLYPYKARARIWWGHDDLSSLWNYQDIRRPAGLGLMRLIGWLIRNRADKFFVVSKWMSEICQKYMHIPKERLFVARNGVNLPYFDKPIKKEGSRLAYTSIPDRGLDVLLDMFPMIRHRVPEAELHIFCGEDLGILNQKDKVWSQKILSQAKQPNVFIRGTKKHSELAEELLKCSLWVYPSHAVPRKAFFAETSCIAALEALAAGTPVIASSRGALPEIVKNRYNGILLVGDPHFYEYQNRFVDEVVSLLKDPAKLNALSENARNEALAHYSWKTIAQQWESELKCLISR